MVDGTYNNTNIKNDINLETSLNMGLYDATNYIPIELKLKGFEKIKKLILYIKQKNIDNCNLIFVLD